MKNIHLSLVAAAILGLATGCEHTEVVNTDTVNDALTSKYVLSNVVVKTASLEDNTPITNNSGLDSLSYTQDGYVLNASPNSITFNSTWDMIKKVTGTTTETYNADGIKLSSIKDTDTDDNVTQGVENYKAIFGTTIYDGYAYDDTAPENGIADNLIEQNATSLLVTKSGGMDAGDTYQEFDTNGYLTKEVTYDGTHGAILTEATYSPLASTALVANELTRTVNTYSAKNTLATVATFENGMLTSYTVYKEDGEIDKEHTLAYGTIKVKNSDLFNRNGGLTSYTYTDHSAAANTLAYNETYVYNEANYTITKTVSNDANSSGVFDTAEVVVTNENGTAVTLGGNLATINGLSPEFNYDTLKAFVSGKPAKYDTNNSTISYDATSNMITLIANETTADTNPEWKATYDATTGYLTKVELDTNSDGTQDTITVYSNGVAVSKTEFTAAATNTALKDTTYAMGNTGANTNGLITTSVINWDAATGLIKQSETTKNLYNQAVLTLVNNVDGTLNNKTVRTYDTNFNVLTNKTYTASLSETNPTSSVETTYDENNYSFDSSVKVTQTTITDNDADGVFENKIVRSWGANGIALAKAIAEAGQVTTDLTAAGIDQSDSEAWFDAHETSILVYSNNQTTADINMTKTFVENGTASYRSHVDSLADVTLAPTTVATGTGYSTIDVLNSHHHITEFKLTGTVADETRTFTWESKE